MCCCRSMMFPRWEKINPVTSCTSPGRSGQWIRSVAVSAEAAAGMVEKRIKAPPSSPNPRPTAKQYPTIQPECRSRCTAKGPGLREMSFGLSSSYPKRPSLAPRNGGRGPGVRRPYPLPTTHLSIPQTKRPSLAPLAGLRSRTAKGPGVRGPYPLPTKHLSPIHSVPQATLPRPRNGGEGTWLNGS